MKNQKATILCLCLIITQAHAAGWHVDAIADAGSAPIHTASQRLNLATGLSNDYSRRSSQNNVWGAGIRLNYAFNIRHHLNLRAGLRGQYLQTQSKYAGGTVQPLVNESGNFDTLNYQYKMHNMLLMGELQWLWQPPKGPFHPYLNMDMGVAWNTLYDYKETTPTGSSAAPMTTPFRDHTRAQFACGVGAGIETTIHHLGIQLGYQFFALGRGRLGTTRVQTTGDTLKTAPIRLHLFEISFFPA